METIDLIQLSKKEILRQEFYELMFAPCLLFSKDLQERARQKFNQWRDEANKETSQGRCNKRQ
jgi:hypothetical protein